MLAFEFWYVLIVAAREKIPLKKLKLSKTHSKPREFREILTLQGEGKPTTLQILQKKSSLDPTGTGEPNLRCTSSDDLLRQMLDQTPGRTHRVVAAVDVHDFGRDPSREIGQQKGSRIANLWQ